MPLPSMVFGKSRIGWNNAVRSDFDNSVILFNINTVADLRDAEQETSFDIHG